jgi:hypothetical protein
MIRMRRNAADPAQAEFCTRALTGLVGVLNSTNRRPLVM